jgi:hypothetical protein
MARSKSRVNDLYKVFKGGDSELLNEIGALCILFEDFKLEVAVDLAPKLRQTVGLHAWAETTKFETRYHSMENCS